MQTRIAGCRGVKPPVLCAKRWKKYVSIGFAGKLMQAMQGLGTDFAKPATPLPLQALERRQTIKDTATCFGSRPIHNNGLLFWSVWCR